MYYSSFRIKNFKGIKDTTVKFNEQSKVGVYAFVGLNESGKTTILEAIHSFSPDYSTSQLVGDDKKKGVEVPINARVPRHLISSFTGSVSVKAIVKLEENDKSKIIANILKNCEIIVNKESIPDELNFESLDQFKNGDFQESLFLLDNKIEIKTGKQRKWRSANIEENAILAEGIYNQTPDIVYFPTFVFDFPKQIFLTNNRGDKVSDFYRGVFQDILDYDGQGHTIQNSIIRRVRGEDKIVSWLDFLNIWGKGDDKDKIDHVMDRASAVVTKVVFGRWNEIFGEKINDKEIIISYETIEGKIKNEDGSLTSNDEHDVFIKFKIKDGTRRFDVNDRSLGFRWFFSFMLFTQFRVARKNSRPILFLFDEPASNLHAAAQQKLIESFPEIAKKNNTMAYTTHSHYMIEPKWLEQTFIVTNRADNPSKSIVDSLSLEDESIDIKASRYKSFINNFPNQTSYFQPILDRLNVVPSKFDIKIPSVVVEGKSDYYILRYASLLLKNNEFSFLPGIGSGTYGALIALHIGWNLGTLFILDGDNAGIKERQRYIEEQGINEADILLLTNFNTKYKKIEYLLDDSAMEIIRIELDINTKPSKKQILRFFQEYLASNQIISLGEGFYSNIEELFKGLNLAFNRNID